MAAAQAAHPQVHGFEARGRVLVFENHPSNSVAAAGAAHIDDALFLGNLVVRLQGVVLSVILLPRGARRIPEFMPGTEAAK